MPILTNDRFQLTYGSTVIGGDSTAYRMFGKVRWEVGYPAGHVEVDVLVQHDAAGTFDANARALETAFRTPYQRLQLLAGTDGVTWPTTVLDWDPAVGVATNTGFHLHPSAEKTGARLDTRRSRVYRVRVEVEFPADQADRAGRRDSAIAVDEDASGRLRVVYTGLYTTLAANSARAQFDASFAAYRALTRTALGVTFEEVARSLEIDEDEAPPYAGKVLRYTVTDLERLVNQTIADLDDAQLADTTLVVERVRDGPSAFQGPGGRGLPWQTLRIQYAAAVDKATPSLLDKWTDDVRPWLLQHAADVLSSTRAAVIAETLRLDSEASRIEATLTLVAVLGGRVLRSTLTVDDELTEPVELAGVWHEDPYAVEEFDAAGALMRVVTLTREVASTGAYEAPPVATLGSVPALADLSGSAGGDGTGLRRVPGGFIVPISGLGLPGGASGTGRIWRRIGARRSARPATLGLAGESTPVIEVTDVATYRRVLVVDQAEGGAGFAFGLGTPGAGAVSGVTS